MKTVNMTIKISKNLKEKDLFLKQCKKDQGLSMLACAPSKELEEVLQEVEDYEDGKIQLKKFKTAE